MRSLGKLLQRDAGSAAPPLAGVLGRLVAAVVVPSVLLAVGFAAYEYRRSVDATQAATLGSARALAAAADRQFVLVRVALEVLASSDALGRGELEPFHAQATAFVRASQLLANVTLVDAQGRQLLNTRREMGEALPPIQDLGPALAQVFAGRPFAVSGVYTGPVSGTPMVAVAVPVRAGDAVRYAVVAGIGSDQLAAMLRGAHLPESWTVSLLDAGSAIAARLPVRAEFIGQKATPEFLQALARGPEGTLRAPNKEGVRVLAVFSRAPESGFVATVGVPEAQLLAPLRQALGGLLLAALAVFAAGLLLARRTSRSLVASVEKLVNESREFGRPGAGSGGRLAFREAEQLRLGLRIASAELQQANAVMDDLSAELFARDTESLAGVIAASPVPMLVADAQMVICTANTAGLALFERTPHDLVGRRLRDLVAVPGIEPEAGHASGAVRVELRLPAGGSVAVRMRTSLFTFGSARYLAASFEPLAG